LKKFKWSINHGYREIRNTRPPADLRNTFCRSSLRVVWAQDQFRPYDGQSWIFLF